MINPGRAVVYAKLAAKLTFGILLYGCILFDAYNRCVAGQIGCRFQSRRFTVDPDSPG